MIEYPPQVDKFKYGPLEVKMSRLLLGLTSEFNGRRRVYELLVDFSVNIDNDNSEIYIEVPKDTKTDLASIPLICQPFIGSAAEYAHAAVIHDFCCDHGWPRFAANAVMRMLMEARGHPKWKILTVYYTLMIFGYASLPMRALQWIKKKIK